MRTQSGKAKELFDLMRLQRTVTSFVEILRVEMHE
jgi:hypothetical protein